MRSLKCFDVSNRVLGLRLIVGEWYKISIHGNNFNIIWLAKFYGINKKGYFLHTDNSYVVDNAGVRVYSTWGRDYYPLCDVDDITDIEMVSIEDVEDVITF